VLLPGPPHSARCRCIQRCTSTSSIHLRTAKNAPRDEGWRGLQVADGQHVIERPCSRTMWVPDVAPAVITRNHVRRACPFAGIGVTLLAQSQASQLPLLGLEPQAAEGQPGLSRSRGASIATRLPATCNLVREFVSPAAGVYWLRCRTLPSFTHSNAQVGQELPPLAMALPGQGHQAKG